MQTTVSRHQITIVETPADWRPEHVFDCPPEITAIIETLPAKLTRSEAACFAMGHNAKTMKDGIYGRWAVSLACRDLRSPTQRREGGAA